MKLTAKIISILLHPLLMLTYVVLILFNFSEYIGFNLTQNIKLLIYAVVFLNTFLFPLLLSLLLLKNKQIKSLQMHNKEDRKYPYLITAVFYITTYYILQKLNISVLLYIVTLGVSTSILIAMFINFRWKISAHMIGIGGLIGVLVGLSLRLQMDFVFLIVIFILLAGLLGTARLTLKAHTPAQIYIGFIIGCSAQLFLFFFL